MRKFTAAFGLGALAVVGGCSETPTTPMVVDGPAFANAYVDKVTYNGQGLIADGFGGYDLVTEICAVLDEDGNIIPDEFGQTADAKGPCLLWVLTANKANNADIDGPWGTAAMVRSGNGTFKYISGWYDPDDLVGNVTASYDGTAKNECMRHCSPRP